MARAGEPFEENLRIFANPISEPEKHNLYAGLSNLAKEIGRLQNDVRNLTQMVDEIRRKQ